MKNLIKINRKLFLATVLKISGSAGSSILDGEKYLSITVGDDKIEFYCYNDHSRISTILEFKTDQSFHCDIRLNMLIDTLKLLDDDFIMLEFDDVKMRLIIIHKKGEGKISIPKDFPGKEKLDTVCHSEKVIVSAQDLIPELKASARFCINDDFQTRMTGINIVCSPELIEICGTDALTLYYSAIKLDLPSSVIASGTFSKDAVSILYDISPDEDVAISIEDGIIVFSAYEIEVRSVLLEETFPNYKGILSQDENPTSTLMADRKVLGSSVSRVSKYKDIHNESLELQMSLSETVVYSESPTYNQLAEETFAFEYDNENDLTISFAPKYLIRSLKAVKGDKIKMSFNINSPAVFVYGDSSNGIVSSKIMLVGKVINTKALEMAEKKGK